MFSSFRSSFRADGTCVIGDLLALIWLPLATNYETESAHPAGLDDSESQLLDLKNCYNHISIPCMSGLVQLRIGLRYIATQGLHRYRTATDAQQDQNVDKKQTRPKRIAHRTLITRRHMYKKA